MRSLKELTRPNIWTLKPYSSARDEYSGADASVFLDANENPYNTPNNRYPDPLQRELKSLIAPLKGVKEENIFLGNGSDEAIDLIFRAFCQPGEDNVVAIEPTYGMYKVCANVNDVEYRPMLLDVYYQMKASALMSAIDEYTKAIFLCSPNNPTGNSMCRKEIDSLLKRFDGLVVVDEAYIDFSSSESLLKDLNQYPNLIVLQTFSKAWGCAAIRLGMAFASPEIISIFNKIKYPYNVNRLTQEEAIKILKQPEQIKAWVDTLLEERARVMKEFERMPCCIRVFPTDANFFLAKVYEATQIYNYLVSEGIIVRNRTNVALCNDCLRITIGTKEENDALLEAVSKIEIE
jgi:histidinol-phosphate aminotransferase